MRPRSISTAKEVNVKATKDMTKVITEKVLQQLAAELPKAVDNALRVIQMETRKGPVTVGPISEGKCRAIWTELDKVVASGKEPDIATVRKLAARKHWNDNTSRIQFYRWKHAHAASA